MTDTALLDLPAASTLDGTELLYAVQGGLDRKATSAQLRTYIGTGIAVATWSTLPSAATAGANATYLVTDVGVGRGSLWVSDGSLWHPLSAIVVARSGVAVQSTLGVTTEQPVASFTLPAGLLGTNRGLEVNAYWSFPASANTKTGRIRVAGTSGPTLAQTAATGASNLSIVQQGQMRMRNHASNFVFRPSLQGVGASNNAIDTGSENFAGATTVHFMGTTASASEQMTLEFYDVRLIP